MNQLVFTKLTQALCVLLHYRLDTLKLSDADRELYWHDPEAFRKRHDARHGDDSGKMTSGTRGGKQPITHIVISLHPECREAWLRTRNMSDAERERLDREQLAAEAAAEREHKAEDELRAHEAECEVQKKYDLFGYPILDDVSP